MSACQELNMSLPATVTHKSHDILSTCMNHGWSWDAFHPRARSSPAIRCHVCDAKDRCRWRRPEEVSFHFDFDDFEQTTELLRQRLGTSAWDNGHLLPRPYATSNAKLPGVHSSDGFCTPESARHTVAAIPDHRLQQLTNGEKAADASNEEDMSAFSSETQALLRQLQAVKV